MPPVGRVLANRSDWDQCNKLWHAFVTNHDVAVATGELNTETNTATEVAAGTALRTGDVIVFENFGAHDGTPESE